MFRHVAGHVPDFYHWPITCVVANFPIELYADPACQTRRQDISGVLLRRGFSCGAVVEEVLPTRSDLAEGSSVAWTLSHRVCPQSWCRDPVDSEIHLVAEGFEFAGCVLEHGEYPYKLRPARRLSSRGRAR